MRLLVPAASAALVIAVAVSAAAVSPTPGTRMAATAAAAGAPTATAATGPATTEAATSGSATSGSAATGTATNRPAGTPQQVAESAGVAARHGFVWPLAPRPVVLRPFEQPRTQWAAGHRGVDLQAAEGQAVLSAGAGVVAFSGVIAGRGVITVKHTGGLRTTYEPVDQRFTSGAMVGRGAQIGVISSRPGHCVPDTCLHWGALTGQAYRDPLSLLGFGRPILLPLG